MRTQIDPNKIPPYALYAFNAKQAETSWYTKGLKFGDFEISLEDGKFVFKMDGGAIIANIKEIEFIDSNVRGTTNVPGALSEEDKPYYALRADTDLSNHKHTIDDIEGLKDKLSALKSGIDSNKTSIDSINGTISGYSQKFTSMSMDISSNTANITNMQKDLTSLSKSLDNYKEQMTGIISTLDKRITALGG